MSPIISARAEMSVDAYGEFQTAQVNQSTGSHLFTSTVYATSSVTASNAQTYTWTCPAGVYNVSVVCVGAGGGYFSGGTSYFGSASIVASSGGQANGTGGVVLAGTGGSGGAGNSYDGAGGGGAGGYTSAGGAGGTTLNTGGQSSAGASSTDGGGGGGSGYYQNQYTVGGGGGGGGTGVYGANYQYSGTGGSGGTLSSGYALGGTGGGSGSSAGGSGGQGDNSISQRDTNGTAGTTDFSTSGLAGGLGGAWSSYSPTANYGGSGGGGAFGGGAGFSAPSPPYSTSLTTPFSSVFSGGGGALAYINNYLVIPGQTYTVQVGTASAGPVQATYTVASSSGDGTTTTITVANTYKAGQIVFLNNISSTLNGTYIITSANSSSFTVASGYVGTNTGGVAAIPANVQAGAGGGAVRIVWGIAGTQRAFPSTNVSSTTNEVVN